MPPVYATGEFNAFIPEATGQTVGVEEMQAAGLIDQEFADAVRQAQKKVDARGLAYVQLVPGRKHGFEVVVWACSDYAGGPEKRVERWVFEYMGPHDINAATIQAGRCAQAMRQKHPLRKVLVNHLTNWRRE